MAQQVVFDLDLIRRYDTSGPRYTSYPTAVQFHNGFGAEQFRHCAEATNQESRGADKPTPLSLYFHIPFCDTVCFYCGCNKVATKDRSLAQPYLNNVYKEMALYAKLFDDNRPVTQLHWGGGTPTFISSEQMRELMDKTRQYFQLLDDDRGEYSIEIDPREVTPESIAVLRDIGFNRLSLGVQDIDEKVQIAVNRKQPFATTEMALQAARDNKFKSISFDLIYGLPFQDAKRFEKTVDRVIELSPDRLSVFNYAHLPQMFKPQRRINEAELPSAQEKLDILQNTIAQLTEAGYVYIGMDHFAKPDDELAVAQRQGTLYRNFQGYSTHADCDLIALGITSISKVGRCYSQNVKTLEEYDQLLNADKLPIMRGIELSDDDLIRRQLITDLISHFELNISEFEKAHNIRFTQYFAEEQAQLQQMATDGLINLSDEKIEVTGSGRLLIRNICMVFDIYLRRNKEQRFSKVI